MGLEYLAEESEWSNMNPSKNGGLGKMITADLAARPTDYVLKMSISSLKNVSSIGNSIPSSKFYKAGL